MLGSRVYVFLLVGGGSVHLGYLFCTVAPYVAWSAFIGGTY